MTSLCFVDKYKNNNSAEHSKSQVENKDSGSPNTQQRNTVVWYPFKMHSFCVFSFVQSQQTRLAYYAKFGYSL